MQKKRILVVEDEFSINDTLKFAISKENFDVKGVYNGKDALKMIDEFKPHLVLLDIMLPDISGFDLCREISRKCYVVILTARDDVIDKILGMEIGADDYITKPFEIREVIARIKAIFRRADKNIIEDTTQNNNNINFEIDFDKRIVIKNGCEIILKRKEFELLSFLYKNRGIVFTRQQLLNEVWGYDYCGDTRTVDVHIRRLRKDLGEEKDKSIVDTVFGVGYIFR